MDPVPWTLYHVDGTSEFLEDLYERLWYYGAAYPRPYSVGKKLQSAPANEVEEDRFTDRYIIVTVYVNSTEHCLPHCRACDIQ